MLRDDVRPAVSVHVGYLDRGRDVVAFVLDRSAESAGRALRENGDERGALVASVADDDVVVAVARHVTDADAVCEPEAAADADAVLGLRRKPRGRQLCKDVEVGTESLPRHDHDVVETVAGNVTDLEVLVAVLLRRVLNRSSETADAVVQ